MTKIAAGWSHSLFLKSDGSLWAMGDNTYGELGDGTINPTNRPELIVTNNVTAIAAGSYFSLFLKSDGSLWAMGENTYGQLGNGTNTPSYIPELIVPTNVTAIAAGGDHSLFLKNDGSLWAMGDNQYGELGDGITDLPFGSFGTNQPEQIVPNNVTAIAAGSYYSLFRKSDGSLWAMGWNNHGQLGNGSYENPIYSYFGIIPGQIEPNNVTAIAAGIDHTLFLMTGGSLWAMGNNQSGELGDGTYGTNYPYYGPNLPEEITNSDVTAIAGGGYHSLFLKSDGTLWGMGYNYYGQLGDGNNTSTNFPQQAMATNVTAIAAGYLHSLFLKSDGSLWAMGYNYYGQLGDGHFYTTANLPELIVPGVPQGYNQISAQVLSGINVKLSFVGNAGTNYALDRTFILSPANWVPQVTNPAGPGGLLLFTNTPDPATNNFWRVRSVP